MDGMKTTSQQWRTFSQLAEFQLSDRQRSRPSNFGLPSIRYPKSTDCHFRTGSFTEEEAATVRLSCTEITVWLTLCFLGLSRRGETGLKRIPANRKSSTPALSIFRLDEYRSFPTPIRFRIDTTKRMKFLP
ncbi:hypothetical protein T07_4430 [Trichinella nelsoni]|uniref:Uncharacterized protein n=1 Tax=Trichinella nelsoni TaxID=6336 RepID=A0A0V0S647_9BILA|nr:hypothetical protein T07_4430 [Trichinella nelsoni]